MARPKKHLMASIESSTNPPNALPPGNKIMRLVKAVGNNLYEAEDSVGSRTLVEMHPRLRSTIWAKRGSFAVVDTTALASRDKKLGGEIANIVSNEKAWRKQSYWYLFDRHRWFVVIH